jgi:hypothetical protein
MAEKEPDTNPKKKEPEIIGMPGRVRMVVGIQDLGAIKAIPSRPGIKAQHLTCWPGDEEVSPWPSRLALAGTAVGSLIAGILIGRFLLP